MSKDKIIIIGGKGSAVVIAEQVFDTQEKTGDVEFLGFAFDDEAFYPEINGFPVLSKTKEVYAKYEKYDDVKFIFALYRPDLVKERIVLRDSYGIPLDRWANFKHHSAYIARSVKMGFGNVVLANSVVNPGVVMGNFNTIQSNALIGHDNHIGNSNFFTGHCVIGSNNTIGDGCFFGLNCSLNNYITIGNYVFCAMASNVIKSVGDDAMVMGNPAHVVEKKIKPL
jgi:UDP-3-O-[3-hydroxymyristoyl] glucosamine N-acyltransferase